MECLLLHLLIIAGLLLIYRAASRDEKGEVARCVLYAWIAVFLVISFCNMFHEITGWWPPNCPRVDLELLQRLVAIGALTACNLRLLLCSHMPATDHLLQELRQRQTERQRRRVTVRPQTGRRCRLRCFCAVHGRRPRPSGFTSSADADTEDLEGAGIYARYENRSRVAAEEDAPQPGAEGGVLSGDGLPADNNCCHTEHLFELHHPEDHQGADLPSPSRVIYHWHKGKMVETIISRRPASSPGFRIKNPTGLTGQHKGGNADVASDEVHRNKSQSIVHTGESGDASRKTSAQDVQHSGNGSGVQVLDTDHRTKNRLPGEDPESELSPIISGSHHQEKGKKVETTVANDSRMPISGSSANGRQKLSRAAVLQGDTGRRKKLRVNGDIIDRGTETKKAGTQQLKPRNSDSVMQAADNEYITDRQAEAHLEAESSRIISAINNFVKREELEATVRQGDSVPSLKTSQKVFHKKIPTGFSGLRERGTADVASDEVSQNKSRMNVDTDGREDPHKGGTTKPCKSSIRSKDIMLNETGRGQILVSDPATTNGAEAKADSSAPQRRKCQPKFDYPSELPDQNKITGKERPHHVLNFDETIGVGFYLPKLPKDSVDEGPVSASLETKNSVQKYPSSSVRIVSQQYRIVPLEAREVKKPKQGTAPAGEFACTLPRSSASIGAGAKIRVSRGTFSRSMELRAIKRLSGEPDTLPSQACERSGGSSDSPVTTHEDTIVWPGTTCSENASTETTGTPNTVVNTFTAPAKTGKRDTSKIVLVRSGKDYVLTSPHASDRPRASVASKARTQVAPDVQRQLEMMFGNKIRKPCEKCGGQTSTANAGNGESVNTRLRAVDVPVEPAVQQNNSTEAAKYCSVMRLSKIPVESNSTSPPEWRIVPFISEIPAPAKQTRSPATVRTPPPPDNEKNTKSRRQLPDNGSQTQQPPSRARRSLRLILSRVNSTSGQDADGAGHRK